MKTPVETPAGMQVELQVAEGVGAPVLSGAAAQAQLQTQLQQWLLIVAREVARVAAAAADNLDAAQLCVRVCDAEESRALNESYRGKAEPTNVLSFSAAVDVPGPRLLGDLAICWPVVQREAHEQGKELAHHFTHLYIHGVLHLLGFDHQEDEQAGTMEALEITILQELGIANPYLVSAT